MRQREHRGRGRRRQGSPPLTQTTPPNPKESALDAALPGGMEGMDDETNGDWRIFSKLGAGYSSSRQVGEIVTARYTCVPDGGGQGGGVEFSIAARGSVENDVMLVGAQALVEEAVEAVVRLVVGGAVG